MSASLVGESLRALSPVSLNEALAEGMGVRLVVGGRAVNFRVVESADDSQVWRAAEAPLELRLRVERRDDYGAICWRSEVVNTGDDVVVLDHVFPLALPLGGAAQMRRLVTAGGGTTEFRYPPLAYRTEEIVTAHEYEIGSHPGGRSSNQHLPLMLVCLDCTADAPGLFCGLEWSATWFMRLARVGAVHELVGGPRVHDLRLEPGELLRLPPVHVGAFHGGIDAGSNALRRYIHECVAARYHGELVMPPVSYDHWFGIQNNFDEAFLRRQVDRAAELGVEFWVLDAGWFEGDFPHGVGNWRRIHHGKFPEGLQPLADYVRSKGMHFGLWFEPERAHAGTAAVEEHPDLFFPHQEGDNRHIDLSKPEAQDWMIETVGGMIGKLDIRWSRWDYNIEPAPFWNAADPSGKIQFAYMEGLYRVLDTLMTEHPHWFVECCSSGGRRLDLGTMRRAHSCWFSDHTWDAHICRYMQARSQLFVPGNFPNSSVMVNKGNGDAGYSDLSVLSRMVGKLAFDGDIASWSPQLAGRFRHWVEVYKQVRHLFVQDFHRLLPLPASDADWDAVQFSARDRSEGVVFAFRYRGEHAQQTLAVRAVEAEAEYAVSDMAVSGRRWALPGRELAAGLPVLLPPESAALYHYRKV